MKIIKPTTESIDLNHRFITELKKIKLENWFFNPKVSEAILLAQTLAQAQADLWQAVRTAYPESDGKPTEVSNYQVTWEEDDTNPTK